MTKPWRWPGEWAKDQSFWRDVATRTVSGLLVLLIAYLFAVAAGYVSRPDVLPVALALGFTALVFSVILLFTIKTQDKDFWDWLNPVLALSGVFASFVAIYALATGQL